jgi:hypothetical protein
MLVRDEPALSDAAAAETESLKREREGRKLLDLCQQHRAEADAAARRLGELRPQLQEQKTQLRMSEEELARLESSVSEAEQLLERALEAGGLVRRWRGLPRPEEQEELLDSLKRQKMLVATAVAERRETLDESEQEERALAALVAAWDYLPAVAAQTEVVDLLHSAAEAAAATRSALEITVRDARAAVAELGEPRTEFQQQYRQMPEEAVEEARDLEQRLDAARSKADEARRAAGDARATLESGLEVQLNAVREWGLSTLRSSEAEAVLEELRRARVAGEAMIAGTDRSALAAEQQTLNSRIREIDFRLGLIEEELKQVEELVVGEAWVIATTLTRAYKRDSIQKRRFDTVILDEASMAPIPALWVAAALADANVVLVGDFRQLPPIKHADTQLAETWLGTDVFDASGVKAAYQANEPPAHFVPLQEQFRMHPQISAIPNRFLYSGQLRDAPGVELDNGRLGSWYAYDWGHDAPVLLVDTGSLNAWVTSVNNAGRGSRLNFLSATVCVDLAEMLLRPDRPEPPDGHARILLGAPYRPQAKLLNLLLREQGLDRDVRAGTAHTFQGSEAPVMIFDLVNDEPHWKVAMFMASRSEDFKRLLNVALTRAQRRLILVGDFEYIAKQGKKAFVRELLDFLRNSYPAVDAAQIIPAGLSARAAGMQLQIQGGTEPTDRERIVVTQALFDRELLPDIARARERVVIFSPFLTSQRVATLQPQLRGAVERGARVWVVTKGGEERKGQLDTYRQIERTLEDWGVTVIHKAKMHEKLVFIDDAILWHGSLNPLSFSDTQEIMERRHSRVVVEDYEKTLHLAELLAAYDSQEAGEQTCPYCLTGEVVATEGLREPFYWRCVNDDCFTRSIGDPMPKDGMVVCSSDGCGLAVHFGFWGEVPHWRCKANSRHRTKIAKSHLRLPKMRELIPARELKKLDKQFGLG